MDCVKSMMRIFSIPVSIAKDSFESIVLIRLIVGETEFRDIDKLPTAACTDGDMLLHDKDIPQSVWRPEKLANGKWACNHKCKDKTACVPFKHTRISC